MGKLMIKGEAKRRVEADVETITIRFQSREDTSSNAANKVISDCELFLEMIKELGVNLSQIHISNDEIEQEDFDDEIKATATRELEFDVKFDIKFNNDILDIIQNNDLNVDFEVEHSLSYKSSLHEELLQDAVADSRKKAELIASSTGQKIIGIDEVRLGEVYAGGSVNWMCQERIKGRIPRKEMLSDQLKAPILTESETVNVTWVME